MRYRNIEFTLPFGDRLWQATIYAWGQMPVVLTTYATDEWDARRKFKDAGKAVFGVESDQVWVENLVSVEADTVGGVN